MAMRWSRPARAALCGLAFAGVLASPRMSPEALASPPVQYYSPDMARAFASLATLSYCAGVAPRGVPSGLKKAVENNCGSGKGSVCKAAGFQVTKGSVKLVNLADMGQKNSLFSIVAKWTRVNDGENITHYMPESSGCLVAVRGTIGSYPEGANWKRNKNFSQVAVPEWPDCRDCKVYAGYYPMWSTLQPAIVNKLESLGCTAGKASPVYVTGHSLGGGMSQLLMYGLKYLGYNVQLSYVFEAPRPGNSHFATAFARIMARDVPIFHVSHAADKVPAGPTLDFKVVPYQVYYRGGDPTEYTICYDPSDTLCGINKIPRGQLESATAAVRTSSHCVFPEAPYGNFCMFTGSAWSMYMGATGLTNYNKVCRSGGMLTFAHKADSSRFAPEGQRQLLV